jgi:hypothetical protein
MESMGMVSPERHMVGELGAGLVDPFSTVATGAKLAHGMTALMPLMTDLRKSNQALKALEPEAGTLGSNLGNVASKEDALRLYHGSPEENLSQVQDKGLFGGVFGHASKDVALSHGDHIYHSDIPESKILTNYDLNYNLPDKKVSKALINNLPHLARNKDLREKAREAIVEDKGVFHLDEDDLQKIFGTSDPGEASWEAQKVRGAIAKDLGYQAVQMEDEHGTSHLILPGAKLHKSSKEIEKMAEGGNVPFERHREFDYEPRPIPLHHFPITEDMKKDVLSNGLPMYRNGGLVQI